MIRIVKAILFQYPVTQAIYLFGSWGTEHQTQHSDLDIAVLLPSEVAKHVAPWEWLTLSQALASAAGVEKADLINLRQVDTVLRKEVIAANRRIWCADESATLEFEALTLSLYHQLQFERQDIINDAIKTGRFRHA
jgi:predicted nucleotidyltransferase